MSFNEDILKNFLQDLAKKENTEPQNARLNMEEGKVSIFSLSAPGIRINEEKGLAAVKNYFQQKDYSKNLVLPVEKIQPEISTDSINNLGITSLIGEGTSNFSGSPKNRIYNINVALKRFNGTLIKPGEEFSFVKTLGEVDENNGYLPELVIKGDETVPDYGGGICQVSTTTFRAAIQSGLKITARTPHAYPVSYYNPQGMDATVYVPRPDLRFENNTPGYILIQTKIEGMKLIFDFYGTDDGRKVNIIGPKILEYNPDGSMKTSFTQKVYDKQGELILEDTFKSAYDSPAKYPHPGQETIFTEKPDDWSKKQWKAYKKEHNL